MNTTKKDLFQKVTDTFFTILSGQYKSIYVLSLMTLFNALRLYKTKLKRSDYAALLISDLRDFIEDYNLDTDSAQDDEFDRVHYEKDLKTEPNEKANYIIRKLIKNGWIDIGTDLKTNTQYIYVRKAAFLTMQLIENLMTDKNTYIPLVHQTYSELKLEDEKEDETMFKTLAAALKNMEQFDLNVTILYHSICSYSHHLNDVVDPNRALNLLFDNYNVEINDKLYNPMKTYDSLGLYAPETIKILHRWQNSNRIKERLVKQARMESPYKEMTSPEVLSQINLMIQKTIEILEKLDRGFDEIDRASAKYTKDAEKKVTYLSSNDKTILGKIDRILIKAAQEIRSHPNCGYEDIQFLKDMSETSSVYQSGYMDSDSLTMLAKRSEKEQFYEIDSLADPFDPFGDDLPLDLLGEANKYGNERIDDFMLKAFGDKNEIETIDIDICDLDSFILFILATVRGGLDITFYKMERVNRDEVEKHGYLLPRFIFTRKESKHH